MRSHFAGSTENCNRLQDVEELFLKDSEIGKRQLSFQNLDFLPLHKNHGMFQCFSYLFLTLRYLTPSYLIALDSIFTGK